MSATSQVSAQISSSTRRMLDELADASGMKKNRIVEDALWYYLRARAELPESVMVPARLVLSEEGAADVQDLLARPPRPTPALIRLMADFEPRDDT